MHLMFWRNWSATARNYPTSTQTRTPSFRSTPAVALAAALTQEGKIVAYICSQEPHQHWASIRKHRAQAFGLCIRHRTFTHLCLWETICDWVGSQTPWDNTGEATRCSTCMPAEDAIAHAGIWLHHQVPPRLRDDTRWLLIHADY